jgi:hypothetical protein
MGAEHEAGLSLLQDVCAVGQLVDRRFVSKLRSCPGRDALEMEVGVDRVGAAGTRVYLAPDCDEAVVVLPSAERAGTMSRCESGGLVEKEELGELARLKQRPALPAAELEPAGDPALAAVTPPDAPGSVVEAAAIAVDEAAGGICDQLTEWRCSIL